MRRWGKPGTHARCSRNWRRPGPKRYVAPFALARGYAMLGDADAAFHWVDQGIAERCPANLGLGIQLGFERLRGDPRFADRLRRIGLTPRS